MFSFICWGSMLGNFWLFERIFLNLLYDGGLFNFVYLIWAMFLPGWMVILHHQSCLVQNNK